MSEYQYYEFQAIDRPLTDEEQQAVARLSSRVHPHPRQAVFVYHWSNFPADPAKILVKYYDAMLYMANSAGQSKTRIAGHLWTVMTQFISSTSWTPFPGSKSIRMASMKKRSTSNTWFWMASSDSSRLSAKQPSGYREKYGPRARTFHGRTSRECGTN
jgi:hypothetical protein